MVHKDQSDLLLSLHQQFAAHVRRLNVPTHWKCLTCPFSRLNSRSSHRGRGINEEDSQNQHKNTSGGLSGSGGRSREISRGQLGVVDTESKVCTLPVPSSSYPHISLDVFRDCQPPGAMTIELDTIHSRSNAEYDDDVSRLVLDTVMFKALCDDHSVERQAQGYCLRY